jgi:hypothetical protein
MKAEYPRRQPINEVVRFLRGSAAASRKFQVLAVMGDGNFAI